MKGAAGMTEEVETGEPSSGDTSSKEKRIGARSRRSSASHRSSCSHHSSCSSGPTQNQLRRCGTSGPQQGRAWWSHRREAAVGHAHGAGLHHAQAHSWSPHTHTHWPHAHSGLHHAQHGIGRHRTGAETAQAK